MTSTNDRINVSQAAARLGISAKALRLYEQKGLIAPARTAAGYRTYGPEDLARAAKVVALRALGLSLAQVAQVVEGDPANLSSALAAHETSLDAGMRALAQRIDRVRDMRAGLERGRMPDAADLDRLLDDRGSMRLAFSLPWPWNGEHFEMPAVRPLNYIVGPLGSGKTVLAHRIADQVPGSVFLDATLPPQALAEECGSEKKVEAALAWLAEDGATRSPHLAWLVAALESAASALLVIDSIEEYLDQASQEALMRYLRRRPPARRGPLFLITRSTAILDLDAVGHDEAIYLCRANHRPPLRVPPFVGAAGYESLASCLASVAARGRTRGMVAALREG